MRNWRQGCELRPAAALAGVAFLVVALFAWAHASELTVDREGVDSVANPLWQLWQMGLLLLASAGVWRLWFVTRGVPWVRGLALAAFALAVFINTYHGSWFGDDRGNTWEVVNALFIPLCGVAVVALWRCGCVAGRIGAGIAASLGIADFVNAYFINSTIVWQIMDPLMILAALAAAAYCLNTPRTPADDDNGAGASRNDG